MTRRLEDLKEDRDRKKTDYMLAECQVRKEQKVVNGELKKMKKIEKEAKKLEKASLQQEKRERKASVGEGLRLALRSTV